jgi:hypothetical protein
MWKLATPAIIGFGLAFGAVGAQAQPAVYTSPAPAYGAPYAPYVQGPAAAPGPVCLNRTFGEGYGAPDYVPYCAPEGTWSGPWSLRDPYRWYRPYSAHVGPKAST